MTRPADVLVVGAGPSGLALALQAHDHGAQVRVVEQRPEEFRPSRALILHPRTLEVLRPLGVTDALLARADTAPEAHLHLGAREVAVRMDGLAISDTAFPALSLIRQADVESVLTQAAEQRGIEIARGTQLLDASDETGRVRVGLRSAAGMESAEYDYLVGCDGQESAVRQLTSIEWRGAPYAEEVVLADVELEGALAHGVAHIGIGRRGLLFVFALGEQATWRVLATRPAGSDAFPFGQPGPSVTISELQDLLTDAGLEARITAVPWSGRFRLQHRLAAHFRRGRLFLAGDAAHAHSPATGQGMNTGIQDAANLGWKLAFAPYSTDPEMLLNSYELERRPFARRLLALTHLAFLAEASSNSLISLLRGVLAPLGAPVVPALAGQRQLLAEVLRILTQWRIGYRGSPLSIDDAPDATLGPQPGRRLPDARLICDGQWLELHALLASPGVHVLLSDDATSLERPALGPLVTLHRLTTSSGTALLGIRPDGYVGLRSEDADETPLRNWLALIGAIGSR